MAGSFFGKIAKIAIPAAIAYATGGSGVAIGGLSAAQTAAAGSIATSIAGGALSSPSKPKTNIYTGQTATQAQTASATSATTAETQAQQDNARRVALNAAGVGNTNETTPLGVTTPATVTKRRLLGM